MRHIPLKSSALLLMVFCTVICSSIGLATESPVASNAGAFQKPTNLQTVPRPGHTGLDKNQKESSVENEREWVLYIRSKRPVDLFEEPHVFSDSKGLLKPRSRITNFEKTGSFYKVQYGGLTGFVFKDFCEVRDETGMPDPQLMIQEGPVGGRLLFQSYDGDSFLVGSGGKIQLFDKDGRLVRSFPGFSGRVKGLYLTRDNRRVITIGTDGKLKIFDVKTGLTLMEFPVTAHGTMAVDPEERFVVIPKSHYELSWYDFAGNLLQTKSYPSIRDEGNRYYNVTKIVFSRDGNHLFCSTGNNLLFCVDKQGNLVFKTRQKYFSGSNTGDCPISLLSARNPAAVAFLSIREQKLKAVDLNGVIRESISFSGTPLYFACSPTENIAAVSIRSKGWKDELIRIVDLDNGRTILKIRDVGGEIAFSRDGAFFTVASGNSISFYTSGGDLIHKWSKQTVDMGRLYRLPGSDRFISLGHDLLQMDLTNSDSATKVAQLRKLKHIYSTCSNDGGTLFALGGAIVGDDDGRVELYDQDLKPIRTLIFPKRREICGMAISPDNGKLATISYSNDVDVWDINSGRNVMNFKNGHIGDSSGIVFAPDGRSIYFVLSYQKPDSSYNHFDRIKQMDLGGRSIRDFQNSNDASYLTLTPDKRFLVASGSPGRINFYDFSGIKTRTLDQLARWSGRVSFSRNGRYMTAGYSYTADHKMKIWDVSSGQLVDTVKNPDETIVGSVLFMGNDRYLLANSSPGVSIWDRSNEKKVLTVVFFKDGEWVCYAPDGRFDISENAARYILWNVNGALFDYQAFAERFRSPGLFSELIVPPSK